MKSETIKMYEKIKRWDFSTVRDYILERGIYGSSEIDEIEDEYHKFLALALTNQDKPLPISDTVDPYWHTHILFTKDYTSMGNYLVGSYIHHEPAIKEDLERLEKPFGEYTIELYKREFGEPNPVYWSAQCCKQCSCHVSPS